MTNDSCPKVFDRKILQNKFTIFEAYKKIHA